MVCQNNPYTAEDCFVRTASLLGMTLMAAILTATALGFLLASQCRPDHGTGATHAAFD